MRKLFAALTGNAFADRVSFSRKVFGKNPNNGTTKDRLFVEKLRGSLFDLFSQSEKLLHTCGAFCSLCSREFIKRGIADLTNHNLIVVQHGKPESVSFLVMPLDCVTDQRHGQHSPQTGAGSQRLPRSARQINGLAATPSHKLLFFLITLASIAFGVCSPAAAVCGSMTLMGVGSGCAPGGGTLQLDGKNSANLGAGVSSMTISLATTAGSGQIIVYIGTNNTTPFVSSITAPGLTFTQRATTGDTFGWNNILEYVAAYTSNFSGNISITFPGTAGTTVHAFGIGNANTTSGVGVPPFDGATAPTVTNGAPSITTVNATDFISASIGGGALDTAGSGFTLLESTCVGAQCLTSQFQIVSSIQTGLSGVTGSGSGADTGGIIDAVRH